MEGADFLLFKSRPLIERYVDLLKVLRPRNVVELGILEGGGTALLLELARPRRLVALDQKSPTVPALRQTSPARAWRTVVIHDDVDQADRRRLAESSWTFSGTSRSTSSSMTAPTSMSRPGRPSASFSAPSPWRVYLIEDWPWATRARSTSCGQTAVTRLIFDLLLSIPASRG